MYVLKRMKENKYITEVEQKKAAMERVRIYINDGTEQHLAPYFVEHLRRYLEQKYGEEALNEGAMTITVPASIRYYEYASAAMEEGLEDFDQRKGYRGPVQNLPPKDREAFKTEAKKELTFSPIDFYPKGEVLILSLQFKSSIRHMIEASRGKNLRLW